MSVCLVDVVYLEWLGTEQHSHVGALNREGTHFFSLGRLKMVNLDYLEALESMLTNVIQLVLQVEKDSG